MSLFVESNYSRGSDALSLSCNTSLIRVLEEFKGWDAVALLNNGNRGDGLIHSGGRYLLHAAGLQWTEIREKEIPKKVKGDVLVVFGCGAYSANRASRWIRTVKKLESSFRRIVILPATFDVSIRAVRQFARDWDRRYTVFCREMVSFDALRSCGARPGALLLGHDLSFHVDISEWALRPNIGQGAMFRQDPEASNGLLPRDIPTQDASRGSDKEPEKLLDYVAGISELHTDRCHGAIAAALMGRQVFFYRNNYFKNQAIYEHSLTRFPKVTFVRDQPFSTRQMMRAFYWREIYPLKVKTRSVFGKSSEP